MVVKYCSACGNELNASDKFCTVCGSKIIYNKDKATDYTALVERAIRGDQVAFQDIYAKHFNDLYYFALTMLRNPHDAEDMTQTTFIQAWNSIGKLQSPYAFKGWITRIQRNNCMDLIRKKKPVLSEDEGLSFDDTLYEENVEFLPADIMDKKETQRLVRNIVNNLPESQRETIILHYFQLMSLTEIAETMGVSEGTVKSRLYYGRLAIKAGVEEHEKEGVKLYSITGLPFIISIFRDAALETGFSPEAISGLWNSISLSLSPGISLGTTGIHTVSTASGAIKAKSGVIALFSSLSVPIKTAIIGIVLVTGVFLGFGATALIENVFDPFDTKTKVPAFQESFGTPDGNNESEPAESDMSEDTEVSPDNNVHNELIDLPHPYASALKVFIDATPNYMGAVLADLDGCGEYEMIAFGEIISSDLTLFRICIFNTNTPEDPVYYDFLGEEGIIMIGSIYISGNNYIVLDIFDPETGYYNILEYKNGTIYESYLCDAFDWIGYYLYSHSTQSTISKEQYYIELNKYGVGNVKTSLVEGFIWDENIYDFIEIPGIDETEQILDMIINDNTSEAERINMMVPVPHPYVMALNDFMGDDIWGVSAVLVDLDGCGIDEVVVVRALSSFVDNNYVDFQIAIIDIIDDKAVTIFLENDENNLLNRSLGVGITETNYIFSVIPTGDYLRDIPHHPDIFEYQKGRLFRKTESTWELSIFTANEIFSYIDLETGKPFDKESAAQYGFGWDGSFPIYKNPKYNLSYFSPELTDYPTDYTFKIFSMTNFVEVK